MGDISSKIQKFIEIFIDNRGYVKVVEGLKNTVIIAITGLIIGILIGTIIATVRVIPKYKRLPRVLDAICSVYVGCFRGTPMVVQLLLFYYVLLPIVGGHMSGVQVSMLVFGLNSGAYISEIMRSGILSVDPGQMEAARSLGLPYSRAMIRVVLPQAIRTMIPSIINQFIITLKDTSILSVIGFPELVNTAKNVVANSFMSFQTWGIVAVMYLIVITILSKVAKIVERRLNRGRK